MAALLVVGGVMAGCGEKDARVQAPQAAPPEVGVVTVQPQRVTLTTELPGRTSASLVAEVRPQVSGIVKKRVFTEGSDVKAGQVLYQIDPSAYEAAHASAKASLARARASLANAQASQVGARASRAGAQAALAGARSGGDNTKASLARAESNAVPLRLKEERFKELVAINAVSRQDYDDAAAAVRQAEAAIEIAKAGVKGNDAEIQNAEATIQKADAAASSAEAAVQGAEAEIAAAEAAVEAARIDLAHTEVTAPISGRIGRSSVTEGALVTANQAAPLATIQQLGSIYVDVTQSSVDLLRLKRNLASGLLKNGGLDQAPVRLVLEDGVTYSSPGTLKFSEVAVDQSTGSITLRAVFPNPDQVLLPGMFVRAVLDEAVIEQGILVPQRGVSRDPAGNAMVVLVGAGEKVEPRRIKVERTIGNDWLVTEGLGAGDRVIVEGLQRARPGTPVRAVPFAGEAATASATVQPAAAAK